MREPNWIAFHHTECVVIGINLTLIRFSKKKKKKKLNTDKLKGLISPPQPETSQTKIVE